tara:strand:- start:475 stop:642 length:168 start_codon:yes stop_codon:yes gene_type:complete
MLRQKCIDYFYVNPLGKPSHSNIVLHLGDSSLIFVRARSTRRTIRDLKQEDGQGA